MRPGVLCALSRWPACVLPKGGDADRFVEIRAAYEELTERRAYWEGKGGGDGSQSDFGSSGWGDFGNFWHAEGESQWREVKMRVKLRFLGGTLEMPAEDYMTSPRGDMSQLLHKAFHGKEVRARVRFHRRSPHMLAPANSHAKPVRMCARRSSSRCSTATAMCSPAAREKAS